MNLLKKRYIFEASFAILSLVILLYLTIPRFASIQQYGPITLEEVYCTDGDWIWSNNTLIACDDSFVNVLYFKPVIDQGKLGFCVWSKNKIPGITLSFIEENGPIDLPMWSVAKDLHQITNEIEYIYKSFDYPKIYDSGFGHLYHIQMALLTDSRTLEGYVDGIKVFIQQLPYKVLGRFVLYSDHHCEFTDIHLSRIE